MAHHQPPHAVVYQQQQQQQAAPRLPNGMIPYPLKDVAVPHPHDVLCGRGT
jgi:hypothetical protein